MHANRAVDSHSFNNETVRRVIYYQMLNTYIQSESQQFPGNAVSQQNGAFLHITCAVRSHFDEMFPIYGLENIVQQVGQQGQLR